MFLKDVLLLDFETSDVDITKAKPLQLAAILLDKNDLKEKTAFSTFIKQDLTGANPQSLEITGIKQEQLDSAPDQDQVINDFIKKFGTDIILCSWVQYLDRAMLFKMLHDAGINHTIYDYYHWLDLWPAGYIHLLKTGYDEGIQTDEMFKAFGMPARGAHDALQDCRLTADVLRKIINA